MRHIISPLLSMIVAAAVPAVSLAQATPTTGQAPSVAAMPANPRVEIFPFNAISPGQNDWIGRGIQESLQSEVSRTGATLTIPAHGPAPTDDALTFAKQNRADIAVIGTYQISGDDVRVNGHLIDTATNTPIGAFAATGPQKNLFALEDALGEQLRRSLPASPTEKDRAQAFAQQAIAPQPAPVSEPASTVVYESAPQVYTPPPTVNNYYDASPASGYYADNYGYANYGYVEPYPFGFYGGIGIYSGGFYGRGYSHGYYNHGFHDYGTFGHAGSGGRGFSGGGVRTYTGGFGGHAFGGVSGHSSFGGGNGFGGGHAGGGGRR